MKQVPTKLSDFGGNLVELEPEPNVYAAYAHLQPGGITVEQGDTVKVGQPLAELGNTGPSIPSADRPNAPGPARFTAELRG